MLLSINFVLAPPGNVYSISYLVRSGIKYHGVHKLLQNNVFAKKLKWLDQNEPKWEVEITGGVLSEFYCRFEKKIFIFFQVFKLS